jgi:hypothetical protein
VQFNNGTKIILTIFTEKNADYTRNIHFFPGIPYPGDGAAESLVAAYSFNFL